MNDINRKKNLLYRIMGFMMSVSSGVGAEPVDMSMVVIDHPGNVADPLTRLGDVGYAFKMGKFDVTDEQYAAFLNAVAQSDPHGLFNPKMATDPIVSGIARSGKSGHYRYSVTPPAGPIQIAAATTGKRPVSYVSWFDGARFANWMANGQPIGRQSVRTTENGAYNLKDPRTRRGFAVPKNAINPNTGAPPIFSLPTESEFYKSAYYNPTLNNGTGGYTLYATNSNTSPLNTPGAGPNLANVYAQGFFAVTKQSGLNPQANYLTNVGSYTRSQGPYGTFDMNGSVWEFIAPATGGSPLVTLRGGGWTSYFTYLQSDFSLIGSASGSAFNGGFRLASGANSLSGLNYELVKIGHPGNKKDKTGYGAVNKVFWMGKYEVTIAQYCSFLNAIAKTDTYGVYDPAMTSVLNSAGVQRSGSSGSYTYSPLNNAGDSAQRPITFVNWFDIARFANWMSNGQPEGPQNASTTEDGAYPLKGATQGYTTVRHALNPNTGAEPIFFIPTEDEWYKAAYYGPSLHMGAGGYYLYATRSNHAPGNQIGNKPNMVNFIDDYSGTYFYSLTPTPRIEPDQNYLTDVGVYSGSPSYYGTFDQTGMLYQWNDLDGTASPTRSLRGGFYFAGGGAAQSVTSNLASPKREANDTTFRLSGPH